VTRTSAIVPAIQPSSSATSCALAQRLEVEDYGSMPSARRDIEAVAPPSEAGVAVTVDVRPTGTRLQQGVKRPAANRHVANSGIQNPEGR
jgi:hypothetical protein